MKSVQFTTSHDTKPWRGAVLAFIGMVVLAVVAVGIFLTAGIANQRKVTRLYEEGITVEGVIVDTRIEDEAERPRYFLTVDFATESAGMIRRDFLVDADDFSQAAEQGRIPVTYVIGEEQDARVGEQFGFDMTPMFIAVAGLIIVLAGLAFLLVVLGVTARKERPRFELRR